MKGSHRGIKIIEGPERLCIIGCISGGTVKVY